MKIRHYGLHASSNATTKLEVARQKIVGVVEPQTPARESSPEKTWRDRLLETTGIDIGLCGACGKPCVVRLPLAIGQAGAESAAGRLDTS